MRIVAAGLEVYRATRFQKQVVLGCLGFRALK